MVRRIAMLACWGALASCASLPAPATVMSTSESAVPDSRREASGDQAIWPGGRRTEPGLVGRGFVASTTRDGGLIVHDFAGVVQQRLAGPRLTGLDVASLPLEQSFSVILGGPERVAGRTRIVLFRLERGDGQVMRRWGEIETDLSAPLAFCMRQSRGVVHAVIAGRRGEVRQFTVTEGPGKEMQADEVSRFRVRDAGPGCAIEPGPGHIYFSHARDGFWRYRLDGATGPAWLRAETRRPLPRSLGVSVLTDRESRYLTSLDHDRRAFSVWRIGTDSLDWLGRFEVRERQEGAAVRSLAGIDAYGADVNGFAGGLVVVQDEANDDRPNMKYVAWPDIKQALGF